MFFVETPPPDRVVKPGVDGLSGAGGLNGVCSSFVLRPSFGDSLLELVMCDWESSGGSLLESWVLVVGAPPPGIADDEEEPGSAFRR